LLSEEFIDEHGDTVDFINLSLFSNYYACYVQDLGNLPEGYEDYGSAIDLSAFGFPGLGALVLIGSHKVNKTPHDDGTNYWMNAEKLKDAVRAYWYKYQKPLGLAFGISDSSNLPDLPDKCEFDDDGNLVCTPAPGKDRTCEEDCRFDPDPCREYPDCINRAKYFLETFYAIGELFEEGIDISEVRIWSGVDNFEFSSGTTPRFGLWRVDYNYEYENDVSTNVTLGTERFPTSGVDFLYDFLVTNNRNLSRELWSQYDIQYYATDERPPDKRTSGYMKYSRWAASAPPTITDIIPSPEEITPADETKKIPVTLDVKVMHHSELFVDAKILSVKVNGQGNGLMLGMYRITGALSLEVKAKPGVSYDVTVEVKDKNGNRDLYTQTIKVAD
jgi:hypothetical protein